MGLIKTVISMKKSAKMDIKSYLNILKDISGKSDYYEWLLALGEDMSDYIRAEKSGVNQYFLENAVVKQCYKNSMLPVLAGDETPKGMVSYVEGWYITDIMDLPLEHAWNINLDNEVVDYTALSVGINVREYFGIRIPYHLLVEYNNSETTLPLLTWWYYTKIKGKEYIGFNAGEGRWEMCQFDETVNWHHQEYRGSYTDVYQFIKEKNLKR